MYLLMKKYTIWLILLYLSHCENVDYSDFHPQSIPVQAENLSLGYNEVMKNLYDNWHSPISYLKKRGYMPNNMDYKATVFPKKKIYHENIEKGDNYFFFPDNKRQKLRNSLMLLENEESGTEKSKTDEVIKTEPNVTQHLEIEKPKNDTSGIIDKVKDKFLSIFSHKSKSNDSQIKEAFNFENLEDLDYNDDEYEIADRIYIRSVSEKPHPNQLNFNSSNEGILSNLTDTEIRFVKNFIYWFKQNKNDLKFLSSLNSNITTTTSMTNSTRSSLFKSDNTKPVQVKSSFQSSTETGFDKKVTSSTKLGSIAHPDCSGVGSESSNTVKPNQIQNIGSYPKNFSSKTGGKDESNDFTVDLDIIRKNGTGGEICLKAKCACIKPVPPTPITPQSQICLNRNKYITKSKFLAHLHHMVDEVGKPPHKPLNLTKVQDIIDKSKKIPTVTLGGDRTTQCAPLRLNDVSFDLELNKINTLPQNNEKTMKTLDIPYENQPQDQSMASKFLQEANWYPFKSDKYFNSPYTENFLDSQQSLPSDLELPLKSSTKREVGLPRFDKNGDIYPFPETDENHYEESPKRRVKGRIRGRNRKKPKHKNATPPEAIYTDIDSNADTKQGTDFDSFEELKDIQFRVNDYDQQAISTFISNLNSPPEVFSFDVDKCLKSAKQKLEPKLQEFEIQSPETRTYYEFLESPSVENERLPLIEAPSDAQTGTVVNKRSRTSPEKRDLLRQYIKGVSSALNHNFDNIYGETLNKDPQDKSQRSPNFDSDSSFGTNDLPDGFSTNLYTMDIIRSNEKDDSLNDNYVLLNGVVDQTFNMPKQDQEVVPNDYSPQSLEIDLDLENKFRDLNIGRNTNNPANAFAPVYSKSLENIPNEEK